MGSIASLDVGGITLDWGKNEAWPSHGALFQSKDAVEESDGKPLAHAAKLRDVVPRLELLGYTLTASRSRLLWRAEWVDEPRDMAALCAIVESLRIETGGDLDSCDIASLLKQAGQPIDEYDEHVEPYAALRLLAEHAPNADVEVRWHYGDVIAGGWMPESALAEPLPSGSRFLLVTEGSSDSFILKKAIDLLRPRVHDFFRFVDMHDNYPFTGTGNLFRFCQGLASIGLQNKAVVIFDNDTEGASAFERVGKLALPATMGVLQLPSLPEFESFPTIGPQGVTSENINGRAVAIECFLDLEHEASRKPRVRWSSFNKDRGEYQGALEEKDDYVRQFKELRGVGDGYNFSKLNALLDALLSKCAQIAARAPYM